MLILKMFQILKFEFGISRLEMLNLCTPTLCLLCGGYLGTVMIKGGMAPSIIELTL
jgi:hypothetical protein